jgi:hypothetical protein
MSTILREVPHSLRGSNGEFAHALAQFHLGLHRQLYTTEIDPYESFTS